MKIAQPRRDFGKLGLDGLQPRGEILGFGPASGEGLVNLSDLTLDRRAVVAVRRHLALDFADDLVAATHKIVEPAAIDLRGLRRGVLAAQGARRGGHAIAAEGLREVAGELAFEQCRGPRRVGEVDGVQLGQERRRDAAQQRADRAAIDGGPARGRERQPAVGRAVTMTAHDETAVRAVDVERAFDQRRRLAELALPRAARLAVEQVGGQVGDRALAGARRAAEDS